MSKATQKNYWEASGREERLRMWYKRYVGKEGGTYAKIAKHFQGKTANSVYKKLGRLGVIQAPWTSKKR